MFETVADGLLPHLVLADHSQRHIEAMARNVVNEVECLDVVLEALLVHLVLDGAPQIAAISFARTGNMVSCSSLIFPRSFSPMAPPVVNQVITDLYKQNKQPLRVS